MQMGWMSGRVGGVGNGNGQMNNDRLPALHCQHAAYVVYRALLTLSASLVAPARSAYLSASMHFTHMNRPRHMHL